MATTATRNGQRITTKHPAKFSDAILDKTRRIVGRFARDEGATASEPLRLLDPFAGVGRVHALATPSIETTGIEIEPEWAGCVGRTITGDALKVMSRPSWAGRFDVVFTSPTYGNRFADHHDAKDASSRRGYKFDLGRDPSPGSSATLHWGPEYRHFHLQAWDLVFRVLRPGGLFVLNVSDHQRGKEMKPVAWWHHGAVLGVGFVEVRAHRIVTPRLQGVGAEKTAGRAEHEWIFEFERP